MLSTVCKSSIAFLIALSGSAVACVPSENFDIYFSTDSSEISSSEVLRLADWVVDQKLAYATHVTGEMTQISGHAEERERDPKKLAEARLAAGRSLLRELDFLRGEVDSGTSVYTTKYVENGKRVEISFLPDCPNKCCGAGN
jgi:hypothetical protein